MAETQYRSKTLQALMAGQGGEAPPFRSKTLRGMAGAAKPPTSDDDGAISSIASALGVSPEAILAAITPAVAPMAAPTAGLLAAGKWVANNPERAKDMAIDTGKEVVADTAAIIAGGPAVMTGGPMLRGPIREVIRSQMPGEPETTVGEDVQRGLEEGAIETVANVVTTGAGAMAAQAPRYLAARFSRSKLLSGLGKYMQKIAEHRGPIKSQLEAAGRVIEESVKLAGDTPVSPQAFINVGDELAKSQQNPFTGKLNPLAEEVIGAAEKLASKKVTLGELQEGLSYWTRRAADLANDPPAQRIALMAKEGMSSALEEATGNKALGQAAELLAQGRRDYAQGKAGENLQDLLLASEDRRSVQRLISPGKLADRASGPEREGTETLARMAAGPQGQSRWRQGVDAAKVLSQSEPSDLSALPEMVRNAIPKAALGPIRAFFNRRNVLKVFSDKTARDEFIRLVAGEEIEPTAEAVIASVTRIATRIGARPPALPKAADNRDQRRIASSQR